MRATKKSALLAVTSLTLLLGAIGCGGSSTNTKGSDDPYAGNLTYWFDAESNAPGSTDWMRGMIKKYEAMHPKVHIKLVPQSDDVLIGAFTTASQTRSGPDMATQWAGVPTLTPAWNGASVPVSDYVSKSEMDNWINTQENLYNGKVWGMPSYILGIPFVWNKQLFKKAGLDPNRGPATWSELMSDCAKLKAAGITPIGMGNKDGWFGAWFYATVGKQQLDSAQDIKDAMLGKTKFSSPKYSAFYTAFQQLVKQGCVNNDDASLTEEQGWSLFPAKKAAMSWTTDARALQWEKILGSGSIGVGPTPQWGNGKIAGAYSATQGTSELITSWSKHKRAAAAFLVWRHSPEVMRSWYKATGLYPADKRFPISAIKGATAKRLFELDTQPGAIWPENYLPLEVDSNADLPAGQLITSGSGTPAQAVDLWMRVLQQWKTQHPSEYKNYQKWAKS